MKTGTSFIKKALHKIGLVICLVLLLSPLLYSQHSDTQSFWRGIIPVTNDPKCFGVSADEDKWPYGKISMQGGKWGDIEIAPGVFDFFDLDRDIMRKTANGWYVWYFGYTGPASPDWLQTNGVEWIFTDDIAHRFSAGGYPNYFDPDYQFYLKRCLNTIIEHFTNYPPQVRSKLIFAGWGWGATGDATPWKGTPLPAYEALLQTYPGYTNGWFRDWYMPMMMDYVYKQLKNIQPIIHSYGDYHDGGTNLRAPWQKRGYQGHFTMLKQDQTAFNEQYWQRHSVPTNDWFIRSRSETSGHQSHGYWWERQPWNMWNQLRYLLHYGVSIENVSKGIDDNPDMWPAFEWYTDRANADYLNPVNSKYAFCSLRMAIDSYNTDLYPESVYGVAHPRSPGLQRMINLADAFAAFGAQQGDPVASVGGTLVQRATSSWNDVCWNCITSNYNRWLYQIDPDTTSQGWYAVGPSNQYYGAYARGFHLKKDSNSDGVFEIGDNNTSVNTNYLLRLSIHVRILP